LYRALMQISLLLTLLYVLKLHSMNKISKKWVESLILF
jgi:hypothetical protein